MEDESEAGPNTVADHGYDDAARKAWDDDSLPNRSWWDGFSFERAPKLGSNTFVQVPDRFRGAFVAARRKTLEMLFARTARGEDATSEWKLTLHFDTLLLASTGDGRCAELFEERLALFWGPRGTLSGLLLERACER